MDLYDYVNLLIHLILNFFQAKPGMSTTKMQENIFYLLYAFCIVINSNTDAFLNWFWTSHIETDWFSPVGFQSGPAETVLVQTGLV